MLSLTPIQEAHAPAGPLTVEGGLMVWTVIVFLILLAILRKFAWPAILGAVQAREAALEAQLAEAARDRAGGLAAGRAQEAGGRRQAQAHAIISDARVVAEKERAVATEKTKAEQEELLGRARREIAAERDRAVADLRREAVDLSLAAASKLIGERLGSESDRKLVMDYLGTLESRN
jgi:F-type H+-transporting ATPase subunit b